MAGCNFSIEFSGSAEELVQQAKEGITKVKGKLIGDSNSGSFHIPTPLGNIKGGYIIENSVITLNIDDKPMLLSCKRIEAELRKFLE